MTTNTPNLRAHARGRDPRSASTTARAALPAALAILLVLAAAAPASAQERPAPAAPVPQTGLVEKFSQIDKFRQLEEILPTPNDYRTASGAPGARYWQQRADYDIDVELDDAEQRVRGAETITYHNNSPDTLSYLWLQIDPNHFAADSDARLTGTGALGGELTAARVRRAVEVERFDGAARIEEVVDAEGRPLRHTVVKTMMRVDLEKPLHPGESFAFKVKWNYRVNDFRVVGGRTGCEFFDEDGNYIYEIAQWFPRMAAYSDATGWQHKQYLGTGEFTLELGDYKVRITVPADHVVAATGVLQNPGETLTPAQRERLEQARAADKPVFIVTPDEALAARATRVAEKKTWVFHAENVRDFAFASSRRFIWDAMGHKLPAAEGAEPRVVMAMSYYPNEGEPLWSKYSTHAIVHTLQVYSRYTFEYPYPVAISVNGPVGGMEYPMICFNGPRPNKDGSYSRYTKYALVSVIIHEVGHNYFPMIVNSDERQWTWMDEGINTFLQYLAEQEWEDGYPSTRGEPRDIAAYMRGREQVPIMTNSESVLQLGNNAYGKPATALNILRETVLGRELFDFAFREYANRWKFKRPMPADFFRTMEDASGVDLDWFWRGWFYTTDHVDVAVEAVREIVFEVGDPDSEAERLRAARERRKTMAEIRNEGMPRRVERFPELLDQYNEKPEVKVTEDDRKNYERFLKEMTDDDKEIFKTPHYFYEITLRNVGGLVTPVPLELRFVDGGVQEIRIPAEIWRYDNERVVKTIHTTRPVESVLFDPHSETADTDSSNNRYPPERPKSRFQMFKSQRENPAAGQGQGRDAGQQQQQRPVRAPRLGRQP